jgi:hypothetical protein
MTDKEILANMRKLGVRWKRGSACPTYTGKMTNEQKLNADILYDALSDAFIENHITKDKANGS